MPKVIIDGKELEVEKGKTIIQACDGAGIDVPRYCYHPGLSVAGNCRICMVEVEKMPKLTIACNTAAQDGMVVHTKSDKVKEARKGVLEFLLINHPLDCPVCDQAGECFLQDYYMKHGQYDSRFVENKVKKQKAVPIGPNVILDSERCILCSRCVRFCDEITKTHELGLVNRGDREELVLGKEKTLDNNYAGNTVDICPVGALTDRDFRFQTRVWYLSSTPSVCPGCSMGCNIDIHSNRSRTYKAEGKRVVRLKPRFNQDVNEWWMCDTGRYGYTSIDAPNRLLSGARHPGDTLALDVETALSEAAKRLTEVIQRNGKGSVGVLLSTHLTTEELFLAKALFTQLVEADNIAALGLNAEGKADDLLLKADRNPNSAALKLLDIPNGEAALGLLEKVSKGKLKAFFIFGHDLETLVGPQILTDLSKLELVLFQGTHTHSTSDKAHIAIPSSVYAEKEGTFINHKGHLQIIREAVKPLGESQPDWELLLKFAQNLDISLGDLRTPEEIFIQASKKIPELKGLNYKKISASGVVIQMDKER
jgi:NADH-quinone oxidoreductase subunit G